MVMNKRRWNILVVDDSELAVGLLEVFCLQSGLDLAVELADNGVHAVQKLVATPCDLVLMDIEMPVMDGMTAAVAIRAWEEGVQRKPMPIIAVTAHSDPETQQKLLRNGFTDILPKPIDFDAFVDILTKYLV